MGLLGILFALGLLIWLAYRGWSVLLLAPAMALVAAAVAREPLLAHWTQTFMGSAAQFLAQFFPLFLLGALFGKLMEDSGSVKAIATFMTERLGTRRAVLAVVLAGAVVTYGGVSVLLPCSYSRTDGAGGVSSRRHPAPVDARGHCARDDDVHDVGVSGDRPQFRMRSRCRSSAPRRSRRPAWASSLLPSCWGLVCGGLAAPKPARVAPGRVMAAAAISLPKRSPRMSSFESGRRPRANSIRRRFRHGRHGDAPPPIGLAALPLAIVVSVNFLMSLFVLPRLDFSFLGEERWGATSLSAVMGVWSVAVALAAAILTLVLVNRARLPSLRASMDAGANASVLPAVTVASLVGFGAVVAMLPRVCNGARMGVVGRRGPPGFARCRDQRARRADRLGLGRDDDRARCARRYLFAPRGGAGDRPCALASRCRNRLRYSRQACHTTARS